MFQNKVYLKLSRYDLSFYSLDIIFDKLKKYMLKIIILYTFLVLMIKYIIIVGTLAKHDLNIRKV